MRRLTAVINKANFKKISFSKNTIETYHPLIADSVLDAMRRVGDGMMKPTFLFLF
jgi:hypothetical protein